METQIQNTQEKITERTLLAFTLLDTKSGIHMPPYFAVNESLGLRVLKDIVDNQESIVARHPDDFSLYLVGTYNETSGEILPVERKFVCHANELVTKK